MHNIAIFENKRLVLFGEMKKIATFAAQNGEITIKI